MQIKKYCARDDRIRALFILSLLFCTAASPAASFTGLGFLDNTPGLSQALAVSADGSVVVGRSNNDAFRWSQTGGMTVIANPYGSNYSGRAQAVSADGTVIVGEFASANDGKGFTWSQANGLTTLTDIPNGIDNGTYGLGVSTDGTRVAGQASNLPTLWGNPGSPTVLGVLAGGVSSGLASAISGDGRVIVGDSSSSSGVQAFRWTATGGIQGLGFPSWQSGTNWSGALATSFDGSAVVGASGFNDSQQAFYWSPTMGMIGLGVQTKSAYAISADGSVVLGEGWNGAFIWDATNGVRNLQSVIESSLGHNVNGWALIAASGISADGSTIVGTGIDPNGYTEAWVANISAVPLPSSAYLLGSGLVGLFLRRKSKDQQE